MANNNFWNQIGDFFAPVGEWISDLFTSDTYDSFINGASNQVNKEIADTNLDYQRERNEIEDLRYQEETDYNRSFAENERDYQRQFAENERAYNRMFAEEERRYNRAFAEEQREYDRALQDEIFRREDTALERQAESLSKMGINPLSYNMNGLNAGQALQSSLPSASASGSSVAPSSSHSANMSGRGGQALFNRFQRQSAGALSVIAPLQQLARTIQDFQTGNIQRDNLALQNDRMYLENLELANDLGFDNYTVPRRDSDYRNKKNKKGYGLFWYNNDEQSNKFSFSRNYKNIKKADELRNIEHDVKNRIFNSDPDILKNIKVFANEDYYKILEDALTNGSRLGDMFLKLLK